MTETRVAARYAKSLIDLAQELQVLPAIADDMRLLAETLDKSRDLRLMLRNPIIKSDKKLAVLKAVFQGKVSDLTMRFFTLLAQKARESDLEGVGTAFMSQYRILQGIQQAHLTTAVPLTDELRQQFVKLAQEQTGKQIELVEKVDPELIGGFVLRLGDRQIDDSVASRLQDLRTSFADHSYVSKM